MVTAPSPEFCTVAGWCADQRCATNPHGGMNLAGNGNAI